MKELKLCRNCEHWYTTPEMQPWKGNCREHPFGKDQYSEDATPNVECRGRDYIDKLAKYKVVAKEG